MKNNRILLAVVVLAIAALACQLPGGLGSNVVLSDDFSSATWGTGTDADSSVEYANNALHFIVFRTNYFVWSTPNDEDYSNVHIEVTALNSSADSTTAFGVICNMQVTNVSYYFAITPAGQYAIGKSQVAADDVFLTNNDQWANSDLISVNESSYRVGADCASNGTLTLYVNGSQVASVVDTTYTSGNAAVFVWSGEEQASGADVSFDDFQMTRLP
ncbi:MAG: hypothetical protein IT314_08205 [Anaerolineales bacterium]|nr:hypothetical protein [Anaerolineales bacterium]